MKANVRIEQTNILCECSVVGETDIVLPDIRNEQTNILCECSVVGKIPIVSYLTFAMNRPTSYENVPSKDRYGGTS